MNLATVAELALSNPLTPPSLTALLMFALVQGAKLYTFREAMRDTQPGDRAAIMEAHKNMWQVRRRR
ncbi:hypothetical protein [Streptomyces sp. NPDC059566]|uniref:hypothetical protein n=1 Tax=Streptomyces TaxID=1883 RepID=UPI0036CC6CBA